MAFLPKKQYLNIMLAASFSAVALTACMYTAPVDQGKTFSSQQVHALKLHMNKDEVRKILGEPVMQYHDNQRWTYVDYHYTQHQQNRQQLILSFNQNNQLVKVVTKKPKH